MNHISKLYLFSKDTDAPNVIKGFKYQELKTLETWLYNRIHNIDEVIYCDYEEDIFQRDLTNYKSTFRQIKLYSSKNFSFSSDEIKKTLAHFFMLFVKGDYLFDELLFVFETNTSIAQNRGINEAKLLRNWFENQDDLTSELLNEILPVIKLIIDEYINSQFSRLSNNENSAFFVAKNIYDTLSDEVWMGFIKSIKWSFEDINSNAAVDNLVNSCLELISQLDFPIKKDEHNKIFDSLRGIVSDKSIEEIGEQRVLNTSLIDKTLLSYGDEDDKDYLKTFGLWKEVETIKVFNTAEFYSILFAAKHCRRSKYLESHSDMWLKLLEQYYLIDDVFYSFQKQAIYEIIWSTIRPTINFEIPSNHLKGMEKYIIEYFSDFNYTTLNSVEDILNLLSVINTYQKLNKVDIKDDLINIWIDELQQLIENLKEERINDIDSYCKVLELEANFHGNFSIWNFEQIDTNLTHEIYEELLILIPETSLFPIAQFLFTIELRIDLFNQIDLEDEVEFYEDYLEQLLKYIEKREGSLSKATIFFKRGLKELEKNTPKGFSKSLKYFHKAKDIYFNEDTYEGFIMTLLCIGNAYANLKMTFAAKYYFLIIAGFSLNEENPQLFKRISDAFANLVLVDFQQGAWMNALMNFEKYIRFRFEFDENDFDLDTDILFRSSLLSIGTILNLAAEFSPQLYFFIESEKRRMNSIYQDYLEPLTKAINDNKINILEQKLSDYPLNDIGNIRNVEWIILNSKWNVQFSNDYYTNSVAEEFLALLQIILVDIQLSKNDFHLIHQKVFIDIKISDTVQKIKQVPNNKMYYWEVFLPILNSRTSTDKQHYYAYLQANIIAILNNMSVLSYEKFINYFEDLLKDNLTSKGLISNTYQKAYRIFFTENIFNQSMRDKFLSEKISFEIEGIEILNSKEKLSSFYSKENSLINIQSRYKNSIRAIHVTLNKYKQNSLFQSEVKRYRSEGWLDWQILQALYNAILDIKAKVIVANNGKKYPNDNDEIWLKDFQETFKKLIYSDESDNYIEIALNLILGKDFDFQIQQVPFHVLESFSLEKKGGYPNSIAIRDLLNQKFNFSEDEIIELSPFRDIE